MFSISIPFPRGKTRKPGKGQRKRQHAGATSVAAAKPPLQPRPAWDATTSDLSRLRLTEAEIVGAACASAGFSALVA